MSFFVHDLSWVENKFPKLEKLMRFPAAGSQKVIYRGYYKDKEIILKLFLPEVDVKRARREIEALVRVKSPYVPRIIEAGALFIEENGANEQLFYIIEEAIHGVSLRHRLNTEKVLAIEDVLNLGLDLLRAVKDIADLGLIHRDIKPENIILDPLLRAWLTDFGIVRVSDAASLTQSGLYRGLGTLGYAAPEQVRNRKDLIDVRTDLYSVGVVLYECLTGSNPYLRKMPHLLEVIKDIETTALPLVNVPGDKERILVTYLHQLAAPDIAQRPPNASVAVAEFDTIYRALTGRSPPRARSGVANPNA